MIKYFIITLLLGTLSCLSMNAQAGMMTNNPDKSAVLDMKTASNKGLLIPNVALVALNNPAPIVNNTPATGLLVYNTNVSLSDNDNQPGGAGYFYWDGTKWCRLMTQNNTSALDNLGNHTATDILHMTNNHIQNINKTSTQTESIAQGTDGLLPKAGYVATSTDAAGNIVWRPAPLSVAKDTVAFYRESNGAASLTTAFSAFSPIPNLDNFIYTATGSGTLLLEAVFYTQIEGLPGATTAMAQCMGRVAVYNGATLVDEMYTISKIVAFTTNKFPTQMALQLQVPVVKGITYTIRTGGGVTDKNDMPGLVAPVSIGTLTTIGGSTVNTYIMGTLLGLAPLPGGFN